jgi:hypothetical protein
MKRLFLSLVAISLIATSCTENERVKNFGGEGTINLPAGRKLINITWKDTEIWYLTRKMKDTDSAETYQFQEESSWGTIEGVYNIVESK